MNYSTCITWLYSIVRLLSYHTSKHLFILCVGMLIGITPLSAQDIITFRDGSEVEVKVLEINPHTIKYRQTGGLDGPIYEVEKDKVFMIKYPSGHKDVFHDRPANSGIQQEDPASSPSNQTKVLTKGKKNAIGYNSLERLFDASEMGYLEYERLINDTWAMGLRWSTHYKFRHRTYYSDHIYAEKGYGPGIFVKRYFSKDYGMKGFYLGGDIDLTFIYDWSESYETFDEDWYYYYGTAIGLALSARIGYKYILMDLVYIEPSFSGGGYVNMLTTEGYSAKEFPIDYIATPALTIGLVF